MRFTAILHSHEQKQTFVEVIQLFAVVVLYFPPCKGGLDPLVALVRALDESRYKPTRPLLLWRHLIESLGELRVNVVKRPLQFRSARGYALVLIRHKLRELYVSIHESPREMLVNGLE